MTGLRARLDAALGGALALLMGLAVVNVVWQVVSRFVLGSPSAFTDELARYLLVWIGLLGAMIASRNDEHIRIDVASSLLPEKYHPFLTTFVDLFTAFICVLVAWYSVGFVIEEHEYATPAFAGAPAWLQSWVLQSIIPLGFSVMAVRYVVLFVLGLLGKRPKMQEPVP